jgi:hypothetical protein
VKSPCVIIHLYTVPGNTITGTKKFQAKNSTVKTMTMTILSGFAQHEHCTIPLLLLSSLPNSLKEPMLLQLECVSALSPLDMMQLASGDDDSTGHRIWMGAIFFLYALDRLIERGYFDSHNKNKKINTNNGMIEGEDEEKEECSIENQNEMNGALRVVELGCGTGMAGIALLKAMLMMKQSQSMIGDSKEPFSMDQPRNHQPQQVLNNDHEHHSYPIHVTFTDADPAVLELCSRNCQANIPNHQLYAARQLVWSHHQEDYCTKPNMEKDGVSLSESIMANVVLATDVLYDLSSLSPLLATASRLLRNTTTHPTVATTAVASTCGYLILSHVPRADMTCMNELENNDHGPSGGTVHQCMTTMPDGSSSKASSTATTATPVNTMLLSPLERVIVQQAQEFHLELHEIIRPVDLSRDHQHQLQHHYLGTSTMIRSDSNKLLVPMEEMEDAGVAILIFICQT